MPAPAPRLTPGVGGRTVPLGLAAQACGALAGLSWGAVRRPPDMLPAPERGAEGPTVRLAGGRAPAAAAQALVVVAPGHAQQSPRPLPRGCPCVLPVPGVPSLVSEHPSWGDPVVTVGGRGLPAACIDGSQAVPSVPARGLYRRSRVDSHAGVLSPLPLGPVPAAPPGARSWLRHPTCLGLPRRGLWAAAPPAWADHALQVWRAWGASSPRHWGVGGRLTWARGDGPPAVQGPRPPLRGEAALQSMAEAGTSIPAGARGLGELV